MVDAIDMPILRHDEGRQFVGPVEIPMDREPQALLNHRQTLERLKERGGLAPSEAVAIMRMAPLEKLSEQELERYFITFGWKLEE